MTVAGSVCTERLRLVTEFNNNVREYADLVTRMTDLVGCGLESEVAAVRRHCRIAWGTVEEARISLYRHEADHCCSHSASMRRSPTGL